MRAIGSYINNLQLRQRPMSVLEWAYEWSSEAYVVRDAETGYMLGYITVEMAYGTIFTHESLLASWIWRVSDCCIEGPSCPEPLLVPVGQK
jgi:hypothetical protein